MLVPWPVSEGWDEALPAHIGTPNAELGGYVLFDVVKTVAYLRGSGRETASLAHGRSFMPKLPTLRAK